MRLYDGAVVIVQAGAGDVVLGEGHPGSQLTPGVGDRVSARRYMSESSGNYSLSPSLMLICIDYLIKIRHNIMILKAPLIYSRKNLFTGTNYAIFF